jgi:hypothetical protein
LVILLQFLLSRSRGMLPLLPESFTVDDAINRIVTKIWMDRLNQRMKLDGAEGPVALQQVDDRLREDCVTRTTPQSQPHELIFRLTASYFELTSKCLGHARNLIPKCFADKP